MIMIHVNNSVQHVLRDYRDIIQTQIKKIKNPLHLREEQFKSAHPDSIQNYWQRFVLDVKQTYRDEWYI